MVKKNSEPGELERSIVLPRDQENDHVGTASADWQTAFFGLHLIGAP